MEWTRLVRRHACCPMHVARVSGTASVLAKGDWVPAREASPGSNTVAALVAGWLAGPCVEQAMQRCCTARAGVSKAMQAGFHGT